VGVVRAFKRDVVVGRIGGLNMTSEDRGPYRLRTASDAPYSGVYSYGRQDSFFERLGAAIGAILRLTICSAILSAWMVAIYLYRDTAVDVFGIGTGWLTVSHLLVPVGFYCVSMTNRRYGPAYAFAQVVTMLALVGGTVMFARDTLSQIVPLDTVPPLREALAFGGAFIAASFVSIVAFDGARGPRWWTAPLIGFLAAAVVFAAVFFAAGFAGTGAPWLDQGLSYMGLTAAEGLALLVPFWAMRRMVPPLPGFGGY
jgi:uncharacterized PurR-regulated membrane protein YhhQ (DUF165 family)